MRMNIPIEQCISARYMIMYLCLTYYIDIQLKIVNIQKMKESSFEKPNLLEKSKS